MSECEHAMASKCCVLIPPCQYSSEGPSTCADLVYGSWRFLSFHACDDGVSRHASSVNVSVPARRHEARDDWPPVNVDLYLISRIPGQVELYKIP